MLESLYTAMVFKRKGRTEIRDTANYVLQRVDDNMIIHYYYFNISYKYVITIKILKNSGNNLIAHVVFNTNLCMYVC